MLNQIKKNVKKAMVTFSNFLEKISAFVSIVCSFAVIFACIFTAILFAAYIQLSFNNIKWIVCFQFINWLGLLPPNDGITSDFLLANSTVIKVALEFFLNVAVAFCGLLLSFFTVYSYFKRVAAIKHASCFKKIQVFEPGVEDINTMLQYFEGADLIVIYSHTFSWAKSGEMGTILTSMAEANKLSLYSCDFSTAQKWLEDCPVLKGHLHKTDISLHFSYIERDNAKYLLYRQEENELKFVYVVHENAESKHLLETISKLVKNQNP